eukprot:406728_1
MDWTFLHTFSLFVITFCLISGILMLGYYLNSKIYPSLSKMADPVVFNKLSLHQKKDFVESIPTSAMLCLIQIRATACIISCSLFSYYAPNPAENQFLFVFQIIIIIMYEIGEYLNQMELPHPRWYITYGLGYLPWLPSVLIGHFMGLALR